jgi:hypothetical protein
MVVSVLDRFWSGERGVTEVTQRRRHVAHAELDPKQRDLDYVRCIVQSTSKISNTFTPFDIQAELCLGPCLARVYEPPASSNLLRLCAQ